MRGPLEKPARPAPDKLWLPDTRRKTPDDSLREAQAEERAARGGRLKIFLGYASGAGKSFRMLDEVRRRRERGQDIVVAAVQPRVPPGVQALLRNLEVIPLKSAGDHPAIDVDALIRRRPAACVVDALAYDNPPGSRNATRWQDVQDVLEAGINVIGAINIQYVAELSEQVEAITGQTRRIRSRRSSSRGRRDRAGGRAGGPADGGGIAGTAARRRPARATPFQTAGTGAGAGGGRGGLSAQRVPGASRDPPQHRRTGAHHGMHYAARQCGSHDRNGARDRDRGSTAS